MLERIEKVIASLERISVSGLGAILMGEALKELLAMKAEAEKLAEKEGEKECQM